MTKIFITGSSDGIGLEAAKILLKEGHEVVLHARNASRAKELEAKLEKPCKILVADLSDRQATQELASAVNLLGEFDVIIHNAGLYQAPKQDIFRVNVIAPYILTALIKPPKRLIYIGSNMHTQGLIEPERLTLGVDYSTSKLLILMLSFALARRWRDCLVNTVDPGWVRTKMANYNAPDSIADGTETQVWLASDQKADVSGGYFYHLKEQKYSPKADNQELQEQLIQKYEALTGIKMP